jgi:hypothetical protein
MSFTPYCIGCGREAVIFDKQIGEWVCQGNQDCGLSRSPYLFSGGTKIEISAVTSTTVGTNNIISQS